ncbi:hypothetical protein AB0K00_54770 [Dactylosporangium sp. NPDC049525]|uniref:hypothetical protein n=1 Tax=Dactylosporangium sp. NPDC049525 TaxID=3154730 RepID=UPI00342697DB
MAESFAAVPLPTMGPGGDRAALVDGMVRWLTSPAMTALLDAFGLPPLPKASPADRLAAIDQYAERWDYRKGTERDQLEHEIVPPALDALIRATTTALGLAGRQTPSSAAYDHVLVLGGGVRTMMARASLASDVIRSGVLTSTVAGLGTMRALRGQGEEITRSLGLRPCPTEADAIHEVLRATLHLDGPWTSRAGPDWWVRSYSDALPPVHVLAAPSTRPGFRATTADTFTGWAQLVAPNPGGTRLLLVTTDMFVPFQHCDAVRVLGLGFGCTVDTVGCSTASARTFEVLQELRSAIRSMRALYLTLP